MTRKNEGLQKRVYSRKEFEDNDRISFSVINGIVEILLKEFSLIEDLEKIADELINFKDFTTYEAFLFIDVENKRYISDSSMLEFLNRHGYNLKRGDAEDIVFRIDNDGDGRISYNEFQEIFLPIRIGKKKNSIQNGESTFYQTYPDNFRETGYSRSGGLNVKNDLKNIHFRNRKIYHEEKPYHKINLETSFFNKKSTSNLLNDKDNLTQTLLVEKDSEDLRKPEDKNKISFEENLTQTNEKFYTTISTINKGYLSPFRSTITEDVNIRAGKDTYTSPIRIKEYNNDDYALEKLSLTTPYLKDSNSLSPKRNPRQFVHAKTDLRNSDYYEAKREKEKNESKTLAWFMEDLIRIDNASEAIREELALSTDNSLEEIFTFFDDLNRKKLSHIDFEKKLQELSVYPSLNEIKLLFRRYDSDDDGRLKYI